MEICSSYVKTPTFKGRKDGQLFHTQDFELFPTVINVTFYTYSHLVIILMTTILKKKNKKYAKIFNVTKGSTV